jgi:triosephosphate isomerase
MHKTRAEAASYMHTLAADLERVAPDLATRQQDLRVIVAPPFTALASAVDDAPAGVEIYAQTMHQAASGAYTGEISGPMLMEAGVTGVILGHSERRQYFGETDELLAEKVKSAIDGGLRAMLCVGESLDDRDAGNAETVVGRQLDTVLSALGEERAGKLELAYEPVWAIGTGRTATPEMAENMHRFIRGRVAGLIGIEVAARTPILYGGSVKPENAGELFREQDIDGGLIGGAGLEVASFSKLIAAGAGVPAVAGA